MGSKLIILLLSISVMYLTLNFTGCTNEKEALNQSMIITDDVKSDTEPELKVISTETFSFDEPICASNLSFIEKDDGSTLVKDSNYQEMVEDRRVVEIDGNKATIEYVESISDEYKNIHKAFYLESLGNNKALIIDWYTDNKFKVDEELINNEQSRYEISGEYLIELVNGSAINNIANDSIAWTNLTSGSNGIIKMPEELESILHCSVVGDRLFLSAVSISELETFDEKLGILDEVRYIYPHSDTLLVIDLTNNELIERITIGSFQYFHAIDNERIIFELHKDEDNEKVIEMYNLNNKTRKELMKYSTVPGDGLITFCGLKVFPSGDKIYYYEDNGEKILLKIAEINGMDIENVITAYEVDKKDSEDFYIGDICISSDEREIKIFNRKLSGHLYVTDKIIKIKLSK